MFYANLFSTTAWKLESFEKMSRTLKISYSRVLQCEDQSDGGAEEKEGEKE